MLNVMKRVVEDYDVGKQRIVVSCVAMVSKDISDMRFVDTKYALAADMASN